MMWMRGEGGCLAVRVCWLCDVKKNMKEWNERLGNEERRISYKIGRLLTYESTNFVLFISSKKASKETKKLMQHRPTAYKSTVNSGCLKSFRNCFQSVGNESYTVRFGFQRRSQWFPFHEWRSKNDHRNRKQNNEETRFSHFSWQLQIGLQTRIVLKRKEVRACSNELYYM
jgi:hypothetical protein